MSTSRCPERHQNLPYSSDHLWMAEIHGLPHGLCLKCGEDYLEYVRRVNEEIKPLLSEFYQKVDVLADS